ncbi:flagellar protein [Paenibacillus cremeus]|uniref:Flagellar protein n=2 Tax=Paenibacillus cremeus TaxID=2163881 RepID=A0A559KEY4_9BACL|nr:flagellar protein [Paenibacillus cremeus]
MWIQTAVFAAAVCFGETGTNTPGSGFMESPDKLTGGSPANTFVMIVQVIFFLLLIIGIFFVIVKVISKKNAFLTGRALRSLGGLPLGQNKSIQVVVIGKSLYIVGVGDNIQLLEKIEDESEVETLTEMMSAGAAFNGPSLESIGDWLKKFGKKPETEEEIEMTASFQEVFQNKMQRMKGRQEVMEQMLKDDKNQDRLNDRT